jgi:RNA polymerase sigma factor, sigma-70 family
MEHAPDFDDIFARRRRSLYALALQRLGVMEDAEDAVQETYVKCLGVEWGSVQSPDAMLTTIHLNVVRDIARRRARSPIVVNAAAEDVDAAPCPAPDPEQALLHNRRWRAVSAAIDALPPVCRRVFLMCKLDNLSHADISAATGMSRAAVEKNVVRAMQRLRRDLPE